MPDELERLRARVSALEELLEVHERTSLAQARRLEEALAKERVIRKQLEAQSGKLQLQAARLEEAQAEVEVANTELQEANEEIRSRHMEAKAINERLERVMAARSRFYASMSHELRTPINAILGYNDLLLAGIYGDMEGEQLQGVERAQKAARHLRELVDDILDLSKMEAGKIELVEEEVCIPELISDLLATLTPFAREQECELELETEGSPPLIRTDGRRVRQILLNLVSNAIKFGRGRPVTVRCGKEPDGGVRVEVVDRGEGIPEEDLVRIFDEFVQLPSEAAGGTGLGLSISRRLAEVLGASLEAESTAGSGSTFRLTLPPSLPDAGD